MCTTTSPALALDRFVQAGPVHLTFQVRHGDGPAADAELALAARRTGARRIAVLAVPALPAAHLARVLRALEPAAPAEVWHPATAPRTVPDGTAVVALGGTRTIEAADRLLRADGTPPPLLRLPTTPRAMADAALSAAGLAAPAPVLVQARLEFLETLDAAAPRAGVCALVRNVLTVVPGSYDQVAARLRRDGRYDPATLASFLALCAEVRATLLCFDPLETGQAAVLRYGRAVARALLARAPEGALAHGDALTLGMLVSARAARLMGLLDPAAERAHTALVERAGGPVALPAGIRAGDVVAELVRGPGRAPRQRGAAGAEPDRALVLLDGLGAPHLEHGHPYTRVGADVLREALAALVPTAPPATAAPATTAPPATAAQSPGPVPGQGPGPGRGPGRDSSLMQLGQRAPESR
ncbi:hypothetical protein [Streptomyces sp. NPDC004267]|uniref:3-dehydroquinate synthase family protein n=1 Tax=Streptomyces sp. NPDC004267 TaxID=3364694 RepID=UPI00369B0FFB